jgi:hypothetical protein
LKAEIDNCKAAGHKKLKNIYKPEAWRVSKELEKRSKDLLADATVGKYDAAAGAPVLISSNKF